MNKYKIYFMRGDIVEIDAESEEQAYRLCIQKHIETTSYDVLKIERVIMKQIIHNSLKT